MQKYRLESPSSPVTALGIDPGPNQGALAVVSMGDGPPVVNALLQWHRPSRRRKGALQAFGPLARGNTWAWGQGVPWGPSTPCREAMAVAVLEDWSIDAAAVEGTFPAADRNIATLHRDVGCWVGLVAGVCSVVAVTPTLSQWFGGITARNVGKAVDNERALLGALTGQLVRGSRRHVEWGLANAPALASAHLTCHGVDAVALALVAGGCRVTREDACRSDNGNS